MRSSVGSVKQALEKPVIAGIRTAIRRSGRDAALWDRTGHADVAAHVHAFACVNGNEALSVFIPSAHVTSIPVNVGGEGIIETTISIEALSKIGEEPILIRHMKLVG